MSKPPHLSKYLPGKGPQPQSANHYLWWKHLYLGFPTPSIFNGLFTTTYLNRSYLCLIKQQ